MKKLLKYKILVVVTSILLIKFITYNLKQGKLDDSSTSLMQTSQVLKKTKVSHETDSHNHNHKTLEEENITIKTSAFKPLSYPLFKEYIKKVESVSPTLDQVQNLDEHEIHHTPEILTDFARKLGYIKEHLIYKNLKNKKLYIREAQDFYNNCARDNNSFDSIRSLCLSNLLLLNAKYEQQTDLDIYPDKIIRLSHNILDLQF